MVGMKQVLATAYALVDTGLVMFVIFPRKRGFGAMLTRHTVLLRSELSLPFVPGFVDRVGHGLSLSGAYQRIIPVRLILT